MRVFKRAATCVLIAGLFGLSACVVAERGPYGGGGPRAESRGDHGNDRHDDRDRHCDADHRGEDCRDEEHH